MTINATLRLSALAAIASLPASGLLAAESKSDAAKVAAVIPAPPAGKGQVLFWRPGGLGGAAIRCTVREGGKMIGRVGVGKYFIMEADPGAHKYTTKTEATDELNIEVEPDETAYVKCKIAAGIMAGRPNLSPSTKEEFDAKSAKLKLKTAEEMAEEQAEDAAEAAKPAK